MILRRHYIRIHLASPPGKIDRDLCQKKRFHVWTLLRFHQKCAVFIILFLCYCFFMLIYRIVLIGFDLPEFFEIHRNMSEDGSKTLHCANRQQLYFWLLPGARIPCISRILECFVSFSEHIEPSYGGLSHFQTSTFF